MTDVPHNDTRISVLEFIRPSEEIVSIGSHALIVRELTMSADEIHSGPDLPWQLVTRCVFSENGAAAFTDDDIPALKAASKTALAPLLAAVVRVNRLDAAMPAEVAPAASAEGARTAATAGSE